MCKMISPSFVVANFFAASAQSTVSLLDLKRTCECVEKTANENDCAIDWSRHAVMAILDEYGDLFTFESDKVSKTARFDSYNKGRFVEEEFNFRIPPQVIESFKSKFASLAP